MDILYIKKNNNHNNKGKKIFCSNPCHYTAM